jgi:hypothetical protein
VKRSSVAVKETLFGKDHLNTAVAYNNLSITLENLKMLTEAEKYYRLALSIKE